MSGRDDDALGYKRPPRWSRFKPGQSGNPKGRPRRQTPISDATELPSELDDLIRADLDRMVTVNEGGKAKRKTAREVVIRAQVNAAAKGNTHAQQHVMRVMRELEERDMLRADAQSRAKAEQEEREIQIYRYMEEKKQEQAKVWAAATSKGEEPDNPWPHPDDILLYPAERRWELRGPFDSNGVTTFRWFEAQRDLHFAEGMLQDFRYRGASRALRDTYSLLWLSYDTILPLRWQLLPRLDEAHEYLYQKTIPQLERLVQERSRIAERLRILAGISDPDPKDIYRKVNSMLKPMLKRFGYRSLAEFEDSYDRLGDQTPSPRR